VSGRRHKTNLSAAHKRGLASVRSDINVTPLVDVCLVLLIIFMVVTPMLTRGKEVTLPLTKHHAEHRDSGDQPIVSVGLGEDGRTALLYFDRERLNDTTALKDRVEKELLRKPGERIFLKADARLSYGQVYPAIMAIHEAGSPGIELGTNELKER
jgi:biopolymer transport protein TolR